jgi:hypothetical protein
VESWSGLANEYPWLTWPGTFATLGRIGKWLAWHLRGDGAKVLVITEGLTWGSTLCIGACIDIRCKSPTSDMIFISIPVPCFISTRWYLWLLKTLIVIWRKFRRGGG